MEDLKSLKTLFETLSGEKDIKINMEIIDECAGNRVNRIVWFKN